MDTPLTVPARRSVAARVALAAWALALPPRGETGDALFAQEARRLVTSEPLIYFVAEGSTGSGFRPGDRELAVWALEAWGRLAEPPLRFVAGDEETATVRIYWGAAAGGLYGQTRARTLDGRPAADVFVHPDTDALGADIALRARLDPLFRDGVVYLTCVHELGHAFGLGHTNAFADIMYSFQYGGDLVAYFMRFRERLAGRDDIPRVSPFSESDAGTFRRLYGAWGDSRRGGEPR